MPIEVLERLDDGRFSKVRLKIKLDMVKKTWPFEPPVPVAAGGTIEWVFAGPSAGHQLEIRFRPRPEGVGLPPFDDPLQTREPSSNGIVGTISRDARGRYSYLVVVNGTEFPCDPEGMGGVDVSGPPGP